MSIPELEAALQKARDRKTKAFEDENHRWKELMSLHEAVLEAERALAAAKGEPYAVPVDFPVPWCTGAPMPHLLQSDCQTFLVFFLPVVDPDWDGSYVVMRRPDSPADQKLALVEFEGCICTKMGTPNDEVFHGHSLYGKGFAGYRALRVENSVWIKELEAINAVHSNYRAEGWRKLKHYILPFHDSTFECVASSFQVETRETTLSNLLAEICRRLLK
jgi:hypothetical protein